MNKFTPAVLDAEWEPAEEWESPTKTSDPYRYIHRCTKIRRNQERRMDLFVQRLLAGSILFLLLLWAVSLALLI